jgi:DNA topoisomerase-1
LGSTAHSLVIVESPAKAKTINKYLGTDYTVLASYGHVRDLPARDGSVRPDDDFAMAWELGDRSARPLDAIAQAVKNADHVILATDPDREGEAISWHVLELLKERHLLDHRDVKRVTFNEITKSAVLEAFAHPREINRELVDAYLARRALDYLVGFTLSPVLWRKLPGARSAGRVQSVALRLICEREQEIQAFRTEEYWTVHVDLAKAGGSPFPARLQALDGKALDKFALRTEADAKRAVARIEAARFAVGSVERRQVRRNPAPPFITSTLQQEASRKLGFSATKTMRTAQQLYEGVDIGGETVGLITYMRTDGVQLGQEATQQTRALIASSFGDLYLPGTPRIYKTAAKNAQEAHEAIRPTDLFRRPEDMLRRLDRDQARLYELIWKRTVACQMASAVFDQVTVDIPSERRDIGLRATGQIQLFDGFLKVYQEDRDDAQADEESETRRLPPLAENDNVERRAVRPEQHFTQPPPRYTEASLVKKLEELGIGRPSTYASILQVLQDRDYVKLEQRRFLPEDRGRLVTSFLTNFFRRYVEYNFTADLEQKLDQVSDGKLDWKALLRDFWSAFSAAVGETTTLKIAEVIAALDRDLAPHLFPQMEGGRDPRVCPVCGDGKLSLKLGKFGAFIGCSNYPSCQYTRPLVVANGEEAPPEGEAAGPRELGIDPDTGLPVSVRRGPYGAYVQLGPPAAGAEEPQQADPPAADGGGKKKSAKGAVKKPAKEKPKRVSLPKGTQPADIDLVTALRLLSLPREVGRHPESGEAIVAGIGRFGPYLKLGERYKSLGPEEDVLTIGLNRAVDLLADAGGAAGGGRGVLRTVGNHPADGKPVTLNKGRFGPYVRHGSVMASLPKKQAPDELTLDQAVALLAAKAAANPAGTAKGKAARPRTAAKAKPAKAAAGRRRSGTA